MPVIIQFNPRALSTHLDYALQRTEQLVRIGLNSPEPDLTTLIIPGKHFGFGFDTFPVWRPPLAKREFSTWVLTNGFCDIAEAISVVLEQVYRVAWKVRRADQLVGTDESKVLQWEQACERAAQQFNRKTLPDKLDHLGSDYSIHFSPSLVREIRSINAARNCFVHREGIVGEKDLNEPGQLTVYFRRLALIIGPTDAPREIALPYTKQDGDELRVEERDASKSFALCALVSFGSADFSGFCWTAHRFGVDMEKVMLDYCESHGIEEGDPPAE
jgi:hypothetical protein